MSWMLFMDESGYDHKNMPMEVRGGAAIHTSKIWPFIQDWYAVQAEIFGEKFAELGGEIKGSKLLENKRFQWAKQLAPLDDLTRQKGVRRFLTVKHQKISPKRLDFSAYGQASILMAERIFDLLVRHEAVLFASIIPRGVKPPKNLDYGHYLRKDHVFLQERFFYFLESKKEHGLFVMDQTEKQQDKRFVKQLQNYYTKTQTGISRTQWIIPSPLFVDSELSVGVQAADLCLYCINWGFRLGFWNFTGPSRKEIADKFGGRLHALQFRGDAYREGNVYENFGIVYVPDPFTGRNNENFT
jgi:hypothetical protein